MKTRTTAWIIAWARRAWWALTGRSQVIVERQVPLAAFITRRGWPDVEASRIIRLVGPVRGAEYITRGIDFREVLDRFCSLCVAKRILALRRKGAGEREGRP